MCFSFFAAERLVLFAIPRTSEAMLAVSDQGILREDALSAARIFCAASCAEHKVERQKRRVEAQRARCIITNKVKSSTAQRARLTTVSVVLPPNSGAAGALGRTGAGTATLT